jgi:hypothetical protein
MVLLVMPQLMFWRRDRNAWGFGWTDEGDVGYFRGAVETEGQAYGAEAAVDVELHVAEVEDALHVLLAHGWEQERANVGEPDLAAVGVAGEHKVDKREAWVLDYGVDEVGFMAEEDDGGFGVGRDGEIEEAVGDAGIVGAGEPDVGIAAFDGGVAIDEDGGSVGFEDVDDGLRAYGDVVVAKDGIALRRGEGGEDFGTETGSFDGEGCGARATADEVAGEDDEIGLEGVDALDGFLEEVGFGVLLKVDVGELGDTEALEGVGEIFNGNGAGLDLEIVASGHTGVGGHSEASGGGAGEEGATCEGGEMRVIGRARSKRHSP